jgi:UDP-N-acetylglucosamine diphosphorylase / glucose-1-phosphate thymidylyltransferase / UDP-N-acetylgalactosamine diphosphorylase / glucosamine-1-phosphate N-acetyltransferase / galactosamine-1-phosphate N-acetyltransferase
VKRTSWVAFFHVFTAKVAKFRPRDILRRVNIAIFEDQGYERLLPLTWMRCAAELRCGADRLIDKIEASLGSPVSAAYTRPAIAHTARRLLRATPTPGDVTLVNARLLMTAGVAPPSRGTAWMIDDAPAAATISAEEAAAFAAAKFPCDDLLAEMTDGMSRVAAPAGVRLFHYPWDLIHANSAELVRQLTIRAAPAPLAGVHFVRPEAISIDPAARIKPGVVIDAEGGPVRIAAGALIEPNAVIQGPCCIGENVTVRPGAVIREGTSIGPTCKVGGEIEASIFQGFANKQHDGFLGHSFVCPWVNLGADTVTSDLKNTYGTIRVSLNGRPIETGQRFLGSLIGDHTKTGIGTILPTGCVLGVAANVFTQGGVPKFVPSFGWLTDAGLTAADAEKMLEIARTVTARRKVALDADDEALFRYVAQASRRVEAAGWP